MRQFVERVRRDYGLEIEIVPMSKPGSILCSAEQVYVLEGLEEDDQLSLFTLAALCDAFYVPRVDLHLDPLPEE